MMTAKISTKGQLVIPDRIRKAMHLQAGDKVSLSLEGQKLILKRDESAKARLVEKGGRKVLVAPRDAPPKIRFDAPVSTDSCPCANTL